MVAGAGKLMQTRWYSALAAMSVVAGVSGCGTSVKGSPGANSVAGAANSGATGGVATNGSAAANAGGGANAVAAGANGNGGANGGGGATNASSNGGRQSANGGGGTATMNGSGGTPTTAGDGGTMNGTAGMPGLGGTSGGAAGAGGTQSVPTPVTTPYVWGVGIGITDVPAAVKFYTDVMKMDVEEKDVRRDDRTETVLVSAQAKRGSRVVLMNFDDKRNTQKITAKLVWQAPNPTAVSLAAANYPGYVSRLTGLIVQFDGPETYIQEVGNAFDS